jgi:hypothetical protein
MLTLFLHPKPKPTPRHYYAYDVSLNGLMLAMFQHGGSLPSDSATLKRVTGAHPPRWARIWLLSNPSSPWRATQ